MLNKTRISTMSKMNIYEKGYGKKDIQTCEHFKWDYVSKNIVIGLIWMSLLYLILVAAMMLYKVDYILNIIVADDLKDFMNKVGFGMLCIWVIFSFVFYFVYSAHYKKAQKNTHRYYREMKKLNYIYMKEAENERNL